MMVSGRLSKFKRKGNNTFNHRCPLCGDSDTDPNKARGYHFQYKGNLVYKCHNCGESMSTGKFIERIDPKLYKDYKMERYREGSGKSLKKEIREERRQREEEKKLVKEARGETLFDRIMDNVKTLPDDHRAVKFLKARLIPRDRWDDLYYIDDIRKVEQLKPKYKDRFKTTEGRLVIPSRARDGHVTCIACRSLDKDAKLRYINIRIDEDYLQVYGYDRANLKEKIYVVEGAFDSMFIPNCIAVSGSNLQTVDRILDKSQCVLVFDCEPRNIQIVKQIKEAIDKKYTVALLPETGYKDINEMVKGGIAPKKIQSMIDENTFQGLKAQLEFTRWKRVA